VRPPGAPRIPGRTLFLHDSYGQSPLPMLPPYAERLVPQAWLFSTPDQVVAGIQQSTTVIIETVERDFLNRAAQGLDQSVVTPSFLAALPRALATPPAGG
jgi:hypothetical protein